MDSRELTVELDGKAFDAKTGDNLLESLLSQGAYVRHGCRAGACGACRLYDQQNCESLLSCQMSVFSSMVLSSYSPSASFPFSIVSLQTLSDAAMELTLLGPSDESFGDRVSVAFSPEAVFFEHMALNQAGAPLKIIVQQASLPATVWQAVLSLSVGDKLPVQLSSGVRKGRLLYEMGVADSPVMVIASPENALFEGYWREALQQAAAKVLGFFAFSPSVDVPTALTEDAFVEFIKQASADSGNANVQIIYHGQNVSEIEWAQALRPLRIRTTQLHFVR
ncbi:2Fe-2S iron-sulfur cluster binding domain-containing protein [Marinomonas transparens]|uniref:2Fe-2S iron-sulfur cluster binding domain-containing protein n=1 Tax=Marinomonas transparens TaxID=2795388 RepID=A0A934N1H6_9GAMM|nr:2Fe-2S iron-sulfur cluster binding domain-containing protein [Marinomonas transparens]MBJ7537772.1 2Fe-2S iron-sulfur cluster binding domain-containing protein [Marinomonas transparens]